MKLFYLNTLLLFLLLKTIALIHESIILQDMNIRYRTVWYFTVSDFKNFDFLQSAVVVRLVLGAGWNAVIDVAMVTTRRVTLWVERVNMHVNQAGRLPAVWNVNKL